MSLLLAWCLLAAPQNPPVELAKIDRARARAADWLLKQSVPDHQVEIVLHALLWANVSESRTEFKRLLQRTLEAEPGSTVRVAWRARVLEELNRVKYQHAIHDCAQFLVDNQAADGRWGEGEPTEYPDAFQPWRQPLPKRGKRRARFSPPPVRAKPKVFRKVRVVQHREGKPGDLHHTFEAIQGLRACHDGGIILPKDVVARALRVVREAQRPAEPGGTARSWSVEGWTDGTATAAGISAVSICRYLAGEKWIDDPASVAGIRWLGTKCWEWEDPGYRFLYAARMAGLQYGTEKFAELEWFPRGGKILLERQQKDGAWNGKIDDTCRALTFFARSYVIR